VPVRAAAAAYLLGVAVVFTVPGALGSNVERLALLFTGVALLAASWLPRFALALAVVVAAQWTARTPWHDLSHINDLLLERAAATELVRILHSLGPVAGRVEVVPFREHTEADIVAAAWPLARGWERQLDEVRAAPLYRSRLGAAAYVRWLRDNAVQYVALGTGPHDWSAASELRILSPAPPQLRQVYSDRDWTVWRVDGARPIVSGARLVSAGPARIDLVADAPAEVVLAVRWSRWLSVSAGACLAPAADGTRLELRRAGRFTVTSSYLAPWRGRHC
jgi:hypothetical protein